MVMTAHSCGPHSLFSQQLSDLNPNLQPPGFQFGHYLPASELLHLWHPAPHSRTFWRPWRWGLGVCWLSGGVGGQLSLYLPKQKKINGCVPQEKCVNQWKVSKSRSEKINGSYMPLMVVWLEKKEKD